jgi:hypothetical protein
MGNNEMDVAPLTPPSMDLRDFQFMPLDVRRLLTSETWIEAADDPKLGHALVSLWCESWHQVPAGSLPDNPRVLAHLAMCTADEWQRISERALAGWQRCSDGRLYHPTVCEKAREGWEHKLARRERTRRATEERERRRREADAQRDEERDVDRDEHRHVHQGTGTGTGTKERKKDSAAPRADHRRSSGSGEPYAFEAGVIRLNAKDLEAWRRDYPNLSLEAELRSLSEWAGRPENAKGWFHAVQGGLAKRNRESALAVERVKAEATARAHAPPARRPSAYVP